MVCRPLRQNRVMTVHLAPPVTSSPTVGVNTARPGSVLPLQRGALAVPAAALGAQVSISAQSRQAIGQHSHGPLLHAHTSPALSAARWPTQGVSLPLHRLVQALVLQATAPLTAQRVVAVQHWPSTLVPAVDPPAADAATEHLPALQTWLVRQGVVQTPDGPRGFTATLRVPVPWLQAWEQAHAAGTPTTGSWERWLQAPQASPAAARPQAPAPARPLQAHFAGPSASLESGTLALALESPAMTGVRTSALMLLEFQPLLRSAASAQASNHYRYHVEPHLRQDPWLHMATVQASGHVPHEEEEQVHASTALCDTPGCPYQGETACVQPFCMALRAPLPVAALEASASAHHPHAPGLR